MRRCPKCGRTFDNDRQKFCTLDGTGLLDVEVLNEAESQRVEQGETIRIDSAQLNSAELNDEMTKIISREPPPQSIPSFDPYKTVVSDAGEASGAPPPPATAAPPPEPPAPASAPPSEAPPASPPAPPIEAPSASSDAPAVEAPAESPAPANASPPPAESPDLMRTMAAVPPPPVSSASLPPPPPIQPPAAAPPASQLQSQPQPQPPAPPMHAAAPRPKRSKIPLILGILAVLFMFFIVAAGAGYWFLLRPYLAKRAVVVEPERPTETPTPESTPGAPAPTPKAVAEVPPYNPPADANAVQFVNSKDNLDGKLAEHYVDFSFYYPEGWRKDPKAGVPGANNFAKVERRLPPDFTQENFAVGWYASAGSAEGDSATFPTLAKNLSDQLANSFTEYQKVSEGPTKVGAYPGYEFRFESTSRNTAKGDIDIWGRVIFLPPADGGSNGVTLLMLATSLAPELNSVKDVGVKGQLPMMLESFRFGK